MKQDNNQCCNNPLLDLVYINLSFKELLVKANDCLEGINESDCKKFLEEFTEKMKSPLKSYEGQKLEIEGKNKGKSEKEKIEYIKSQHEFFQKNKIINEPLLFKFITEYLFQIINDCLNVQEIIRTYLSQKILSHISETIKYYNLIVIKDMKEINNNKQIIAESVLEIERLEENEKNLKANNRELKKKLNEKKIDLENQIKKNNKYKDSVNNNNKRDQELLKKIKEENKQLYSKIEEKKNELNDLQNDLDNLESKYEDIHFYNSILISNQCVNEILFDNYMNSINNLNGEIIELKGKIENIKILN